ncbi:hypothetical protein [Flagellimonas algicola]|uniref:Uncharacterized protein n=1 Tax=Flagellimonas algicola TaxID=2583815 RepID=A0ABY2WNJ0_9FLAO|nr:hypothetical protein [Allomuricauda algicola]TMU56567.1 hypothetical protein FGG15_03240 [Allomuricauda algicola]
MEEIDEKLRKIEAKNRTLRIWNVVTVLALLIVVLFVFTKNNEVINENEEITVENEKQNIEHESELKYVQSELNNQKDYTHQELETIKEELNQILSATQNTRTKQALTHLSRQVDTLSMLTLVSDSIDVYYFKRRADGGIVERTVNGLNFAQYNLVRKTPGQNRETRNNTVYYGKLVRRSVVDTLVQNLRKNGLEIYEVKPFFMGYKYKDNSIEIGYERVDENTKRNSKYNIKLYSYRPDVIVKNKIATSLVDEGFHVNVLPDKNKRLSFFSDSPTILYYKPGNREKANEIARGLQKKTGVKFGVREDKGLGVSEKEKNGLFSIHYIGNSSVQKPILSGEQNTILRLDSSF